MRGVARDMEWWGKWVSGGATNEWWEEWERGSVYGGMSR